MKTIRTTAGLRRIQDSDPSATIFKIREILSEQRDTYINRLSSDLSSYIHYKFNLKPTSQQLDTIKDKLISLKNSALDLDRYDSILHSILNKENTYVSAEPFYKEIDEKIGSELNSGQLKLAATIQ